MPTTNAPNARLTVDHVDRRGRWSAGTVADGRRILSIPVSSRLVDYEEDYLISDADHAAIHYLHHPPRITWP